MNEVAPRTSEAGPQGRGAIKPPPVTVGDSDVVARISAAVHEPFVEVWRRYAADVWLPIRGVMEEAAAAHRRALAAVNGGPDASEALGRYRELVSDDVVEPLRAALTGRAPATALEESLASAADRARASAAELPALLQAPASRSPSASVSGVGTIRTQSSEPPRACSARWFGEAGCAASRSPGWPASTSTRWCFATRRTPSAGASAIGPNGSGALSAHGPTGRPPCFSPPSRPTNPYPPPTLSRRSHQLPRPPPTAPPECGCRANCRRSSTRSNGLPGAPGASTSGSWRNPWPPRWRWPAPSRPIRPQAGRGPDASGSWQCNGMPGRRERRPGWSCTGVWSAMCRHIEGILGELAWRLVACRPQSGCGAGRSRGRTGPKQGASNAGLSAEGDSAAAQEGPAADGQDLAAILETERQRTDAALEHLGGALPEPAAVFETLTATVEEAIHGLDEVRERMPGALALHDIHGARRSSSETDGEPLAPSVCATPSSTRSISCAGNACAPRLRQSARPCTAFAPRSPSSRRCRDTATRPRSQRRRIGAIPTPPIPLRWSSTVFPAPATRPRRRANSCARHGSRRRAGSLPRSGAVRAN